MSIELGRIGIWALWENLTPTLGEQLEQLGFGTIWIGGSPPGDLEIAEGLLAATERITVATGIVNIWSDDAATVGASTKRLRDRHGDRFLLGIGVGHPEATSDYRHPYAALVDYLDGLDAAGLEPAHRVLAALGPKVLRLSRERGAGAHPYLTTPEHTRAARAELGPDALLAPEQKVVVVPDPDRALARPAIGYYLGLGNYTGNLKKYGFTDADFADGGSDALVDALVGRGQDATAPVRAHLAAGADHVAVQLVTPPQADPLDGYRTLAQTLLG